MAHIMMVTIMVAVMAMIVVHAGFVIDTNTGYFLNTQTNATTIFHGVNAVMKAFPWHPRIDTFNPSDSLADQDFKNLQSWGFNSVRLGMMWPGVEPTSGAYNQTYLDIMSSLVTRMGSQYGIYTLIDFHQDLLHPSLCGEGIPTHALNVTMTTCDDGIIPEIFAIFGICKSFKDYNMTVDPATGYPKTSECLKHPFAMFYPSPDISSAFQELYTNPRLQDSFASYWAQVAKTFRGNPYVLGFDLFNEPWAGNVWKHPELIIPQVTDRTMLAPLYNKIHKAIRSVDNRVIILQEPCVVPDTIPAFGGLILPVGFQEGPGGPAYDDRQALSYHVYCCGSGADMCDAGGNPPPSKYHDCDKFNPHMVDVRDADAHRISRGGALLTEFGACTNTADCVAEITRTTNAADNKKHGWMYWQYKFFNDVTTQSGDQEGFFNSDGSIQTLKVRALARTYAQSIQGVPQLITFDAVSSKFVLKYQVQPWVTQGTIIFAHRDWYYPRGMTVTIEPAGIATYNLQAALIVISRISQPVVVTITITQT